MALNKQAKILTPKQQELTLSYLERTRYYGHYLQFIH